MRIKQEQFVARTSKLGMKVEIEEICKGNMSKILLNLRLHLG